MKKIISIILALTMCLSAVALLASCGKSAYDIAVENGFEGTEKEWLESLHGQKGDKGDTGAAGAPGEKGDKGDKGDTGAAGAPGEKGDKGDKGDTGAVGADGANGIAGVNGTNGREIEFRVTDTYIQWRYKTADDSEAWVDLVSLESLKGEKGDKGETGESGANGSVVDIIDGMWYIDGEPTGIIAGELKEDGSSVVVTCESITFSTDDCAIWKGGKTPSLKINYVLVNEAGEVVREGTTNVTANMISDVTPAFNGAGEYTATVKFLDKVAENVPLNITTEYELVKTVFTKGVEPKYQIKVTTGEDSYLVDVEDDMITDNKVDYTTVGKYPVTITYGGLAHTVEITIEEMMVYFANFDDIADGLTEAEILALTGVKFPEHVTAEDWEVGVTGGRLTTKATKADAATSKPTGLIVVDADYLKGLASTDYTLQFDLEKLDINGSDTVFAPKYSDDNPYDDTKYTLNAIGFDAQNTRGYITLYRSWNETGLHAAIGSVPNYAANKVWASGIKYDTTNHPDDLAYASWVASTPAGLHILNALGCEPKDPDNPGRWVGNVMTVKIVVKQMNNAEDTDWGLEIYVKAADADDSAFVKVFALRNDSNKNAANGIKYMNQENNLLEDCFAIVATKVDSNWALDNIAIWTGTGEMPTITDTSVYEALVG